MVGGKRTLSQKVPLVDHSCSRTESPLEGVGDPRRISQRTHPILCNFVFNFSGFYKRQIWESKVWGMKYFTNTASVSEPNSIPSTACAPRDTGGTPGSLLPELWAGLDFQYPRWRDDQVFLFLNQIIAWTVPRDAELSSPLTVSTPQLLLWVWVAARWDQLPELEALWAESGSVWQTSNVTHLRQS